MDRDDLDTADPQSPFDIPRWHELGEVLLDHCDQHWRHLLREREAVRLGPLPGWEDVVLYALEDSHGRRLPAVSRAAAGLRRFLARAVEQLLPESGITPQEKHDPVERAMAESAGWEEAVGLALADIDRMKELLALAKPEWGLTAASNIPELVALLRHELARQVREFEVITRPRLARLSTRPLTSTGYTRVPADRINKAVIEALAPGAMLELPAGYLDVFGTGVRFWRGYAFGTGRRPPGYDQLTGVVGLREELTDSELTLLRRGGALAVKIHLALWERAYLEAAGAGTYATRTAPRPCDFISMTVARLCDDVGLGRKKGAHKRESRESVVRLLRLLTSLELICVYKPPRNAEPEMLRGPVWKRGIGPQGVGLGDLFAPGAGGGRSAKQAFSYAPGSYYENSVWRGTNRYVARVHAGLLGLSCRNEHRWAVTLGAHLSVMARMNGYRKLTLSRRTLVEWAGLREVYGGKHSSRMRDILEDSLNRLIDLGLLGRWGVKEGTEEPMTDSWRWSESWLAAKLEFEWPEFIQDRSRQLHRRRRAKRSQNRWDGPADEQPRLK